MSAQSPHRIDYGAFCVWKYNGPGKKARGFWHGENCIIHPMWAYALRSKCGTFWETSRAKGGFADEESAINAARDVHRRTRERDANAHHEGEINR